MHRCRYVSSLARKRVVRAAACAAVTGLSALALPTLAGADDGSGLATEPVGLATVPVVVDVPAVEAVTEAAEAIVADTDPLEVVSEVLGEAAPVEEAESQGEAESQEEAPPIDAEGASSSLEPAAETAPKGDTTPSEADTTGDTAISSTAPSTKPPATSAVAVEVSSTNVSVSMRVASPGDDGPVMQLNVAGATAVGAAIQAPAVRAPATAQAGGSSPSSGVAGAAVSPSPQTAISSPEAAGTWNWTRDCLSIPSFSAISPTSSTDGSLPMSWTWNWNCPGNLRQYQDATVGQYQSINMNIGIRLSSPGNNGPVTQASIAVPMRAGPGPIPTGAPPESVGGGAGEGPPPPVAPAGKTAELTSGAAPMAGPAISTGEPVEPGALPLALTAPPGVGAALGAGAEFVTVPGRLEGRLPTLATTAAGAAPPTVLGALSRESGTTEAGAQRPATRADPSPRWRRPLEAPLDRASAPVGSTASAATGGGSSGGGLPIFLALSLLVAVLDLARRVALERVAWPSGHPARIPDTPG
jgi:hypothetical protein